MADPPADRYFDGGGYEEAAGYARAVRRGDMIVVSGTTANDGAGGALHPGDTGAQTAAALRQALAAIEHLGGHFDDVVRTRIYLAPGADWRAAAAAHAEVLGTVNPANTMLYVDALISDDDKGGPESLVEVEVDAVVNNHG
jgi:enamine deaminase RidA (YjgF/YER057c/UK114 family)